MGHAGPRLRRWPLDARKARLADVLEDVGTKTLKYLYDFGDGWEHTIKVERVAEAVPGIAYPVLLDATGRCPPEDVGGPWGYDEFLEALADPDHESHADMKVWAGRNYDPRVVDVEALAAAVAALAKAWTRKPSAKSKGRFRFRSEHRPRADRAPRSSSMSAASPGWLGCSRLAERPPRAAWP